MDGHNIVAVYASRAEAERARDRLIEVGIPATDIRIGGDRTDRAELAASEPAAEPRHEGFWDWLFGRNVPDYDRSWYETNLRQGHTVVSVMVRDAEERHRVADILEDFNPVDFDETESRYGATEIPITTDTTAASVRPAMTSGIATPAAEMRSDRGLGSPQTWEHERDMATRDAVARGGETRGIGERAEQLGTGERVIPVVKEELEVGKRVQERRYRIRTYTVETPVERDVTLRDERVVIERRPVSDQSAAARAAAEMPREREYEVVERHEEPVVEKRRDVEEVVVHKEAQERTERVQDTVRETRVEVDKDPAARVDNLERTSPAERKP